MVFALKGRVDGPRATELHLTKRDLEAGGRAFGNGRERLLAPLRVLLCERVEDGGDAVVGEAAVDGGAERAGRVHGLVVREAGLKLCDCAVDDLEALLVGGVVFEGELRETVLEVGEGGGVEVVCCYALVAGRC